MLRRAVLFSMLVMTAAACSQNEPPAEPQPPVLPDTAGEGARRAAEQARQDSIARAREEERMRGERAAAETARARATLEEMVFFDYDESELRADAQETLARKVTILRANPDVTLRITGHADERGSIEYNLALGLRRANAVSEYLSGFGISASRFTTETMGEDRPLDPGSNESAWARNRRGEFAITGGGDQLVTSGS
ncbi:MAG: OmpA family protein [Longimicrobiales bacterium]